VAEGPWSDLQDELEISLVPPGSGVAKYRTGRLSALAAVETESVILPHRVGG